MNDLINIENYTPEQLKLLQTKIIAKQMNQIEQGLLKLAGQLENHEAKFEIVEEKQEKVMEIAKKSIIVQQPKQEYVNQSDLGKMGFNPSLSSKSVGKLLKVVGLAQVRGNTNPYREFIPKYADYYAHDNFTGVRWHYKNVLDKIDNWLKERNLYETFYLIQNEKDMKEFIDTLFDKYIN